MGGISKVANTLEPAKKMYKKYPPPIRQAGDWQHWLTFYCMFFNIQTMLPMHFAPYYSGLYSLHLYNVFVNK
jgi:hypothetical protein